MSALLNFSLSVFAGADVLSNILFASVSHRYCFIGTYYDIIVFIHSERVEGIKMRVVPTRLCFML